MGTIRTFVAAVALGATALMAGCNKGPSTKQCEELLGKIVDIEVAAAGAAVGEQPAPTDAQKKAIEEQKKKLAEHVQKAFMDRCMNEVPKGYVECGLDAADHEALAKCEKN
jgi:hypothetical protein